MNDSFAAMNRSLAFLGGQSAPVASDGIGRRILCRCERCRRIWFQDGKQVLLDLAEEQVLALARELTADLAHLPAATCRLCLFQMGGGVVNIDEYGSGAGFGFSWECPDPVVHALGVIVAHRWLQTRRRPEETLPDIVICPDKLRAMLGWFKDLRPPRQVHLLDQHMCALLAGDTPPGLRLLGTEQWRWQGCHFVLSCPPLQDKAVVNLALALPRTRAFDLSALFPTKKSKEVYERKEASRKPSAASWLLLSHLLLAGRYTRFTLCNHPLKGTYL